MRTMQTNGVDTSIYAAKGNIMNLCPHDISIFSGSIFNPATGKSHGGILTGFFPKSGIVASVTNEVTSPVLMEVNNAVIPTVTREIRSITELPETGDDTTLFIVSSLYAQGARSLNKDVSKLFTPIGQVVNAAGKQIGCTGLIRYTDALKQGLFEIPETVAG